uniref:Uncharacterized protein n=1 Tax=Oryza meridionalis TaxID=40149 RepID=A0A0E0F529_9ORYZ
MEVTWQDWQYVLTSCGSCGAPRQCDKWQWCSKIPTLSTPFYIMLQNSRRWIQSHVTDKGSTMLPATMLEDLPNAEVIAVMAKMLWMDANAIMKSDLTFALGGSGFTGCGSWETLMASSYHAPWGEEACGYGA